MLEGLSLYTRGGGVTGSVYVCTNEVWWKCLFTSNVLEKVIIHVEVEGLNSVGQSSANGQGRGTADSYVAKQRNRSLTPLPHELIQVTSDNLTKIRFRFPRKSPEFEPYPANHEARNLLSVKRRSRTRRRKIFLDKSVGM